MVPGSLNQFIGSIPPAGGEGASAVTTGFFWGGGGTLATQGT